MALVEGAVMTTCTPRGGQRSVHFCHLEYVLVPIVALVASLLTLFSGFGLGTLLLPAFALFFTVPVAIAMTALVHLLNNLFKLGLLARGADKGIVLRFGLPSVGGALLGALLLGAFEHVPPLATYPTFGDHHATVTWTGLIIGMLITVFGILELLPLGARLALPAKYLPIGGFISGFFGGLSGHQGALRSAFLINSGLTPAALVATRAVIAVMVDLTRLGVYAAQLGKHAREGFTGNWPLIALATGAAFTGAYLGAHLVKKVTLRGLQTFVGITLALFGLAMAAGLI
jgi:uncharacterized protein